MPAEFTLRLQSPSCGLGEPFPGRAVYAAVLNCLDQHDPRLGAAFHGSQPRAALTVSPLKPVGDGCDGVRHALLRVTCLREDLDATVGGALAATEALCIGRTRWTRAPGEGGWLASRGLSYRELARRARPALRWRFMLETPTGFSHGSELWKGRAWVLPDPAHCLESWLAAWNAYAPEELRLLREEMLRVVRDAVAISSLRGEVQSADFAGFHCKGFLGEVGFAVARSVSAEVRRWLDGLAAFAVFSGTGHKTAMGLGQTRRLPAKGG